MISQSARVRAQNLLEQHKKRKPLPPRRYEFGQMVEVPEAYFSYGVRRLRESGLGVGMVIAGAEWGGENKRSLPGGDIWYYYLREPFPEIPGGYGERIPIAEHLIRGVIGDGPEIPLNREQ